jgi:hypothetical protein
VQLGLPHRSGAHGTLTGRRHDIISRVPRLLPILAAISLAVFACLVVAWPLSYWRGVNAFYDCGGGSNDVSISVFRGSAVAAWWYVRVGTGGGWRVEAYEPAEMDLTAATGGWTLLGFGHRETELDERIWCPLWFPVILAAIPPALWLRRQRPALAGGFPVEVTAAVAEGEGESVGTH